jgi:hypothetical protein
MVGNPKPARWLSEVSSVEGFMTRMDTMAWYGRMGLIAAAFVLVGGIVAAPMLPSLWTPSLTITQR